MPGTRCRGPTFSEYRKTRQSLRQLEMEVPWVVPMAGEVQEVDFFEKSRYALLQKELGRGLGKFECVA